MFPWVTVLFGAFVSSRLTSVPWVPVLGCAARRPLTNVDWEKEGTPGSVLKGDQGSSGRKKHRLTTQASEWLGVPARLPQCVLRGLRGLDSQDRDVHWLWRGGAGGQKGLKLQRAGRALQASGWGEVTGTPHIQDVTNSPPPLSLSVNCPPLSGVTEMDTQLPSTIERPRGPGGRRPRLSLKMLGVIFVTLKVTTTLWKALFLSLKCDSSDSSVRSPFGKVSSNPALLIYISQTIEI